MRRKLLVALVLFLTAGAPNLFAQQANGGGWFVIFVTSPLPGQAEVNLGFNVKETRKGVQGHLNYHNRATGLKVNGPVTHVYPGQCSENAVWFRGECEDGSCEFHFEVSDNGEPNRGRDMICDYQVIQTNQGAEASDFEELTRGNIQVR